MNGADPLLYLRDAKARGQSGVLVTIVGIEGSASRALGTHIAVLSDGRWSGSLSGGCIEAAVAAEALQVLARSRAEIIRFGAGSRFLDIRLPCGGGLDLLFTPDPAEIERAGELIAQRKTFTLHLGRNGSAGLGDDRETGWNGEIFSVRHHPPLKILVAGQGEEVERAAGLARAYGAETDIWTPDTALADRLSSQGVEAYHLKTMGKMPAIATDDYTAALLLFHEHEWETALLASLLRRPAFFIGAMGSPRTHDTRLAALREQGVPEPDLARITGPVGLIPATRDPATLALSAIAQIVSRYRDLVEADG